jgi:hypothetical protein
MVLTQRLFERYVPLYGVQRVGVVEVCLLTQAFPDRNVAEVNNLLKK